MSYHKLDSRIIDLRWFKTWRNESELQSGSSSYEEKFKHIETEILPNISNHDCFYGVYDDEDLMNVTHGPVNDDDTDDSSSEYGMLNPDLLDLDLPMQANVENVIGPV